MTLTVRLPKASPADSLAMMRRPQRSRNLRPSGAFLLAPGSGLRHFRPVVLVAAVVSTVAVMLVDFWMGPSGHHLPPVESFVVLISAVAGALGGILIGLATSLSAVVAAFFLLADFGTTKGTIDAVASGIIWVLAGLITAMIARQLRHQVISRETALEESLSQSLATKDTLEHLLDVNPLLQRGETLQQVANTACESALAAFGADSARVFRLKGKKIELLAIAPHSEAVQPGLTLPTEDYPNLSSMLTRHRPLFVRDSRESAPAGPAAELRDKLGIVSSVRLPIVGPDGPGGVLSLSWKRVIDKPDDRQLAVMQRFADQTAVAWHNALRIEAQRRANSLHRTLERLVKIAPSFHITGSREVVARAVCQAALTTFECSAAALYRVEGDRLRLLDRLPPLASLPTGRTFPLTSSMRLSKDMHTHRPTFMADVTAPKKSPDPWPDEVVRQSGMKSALCVPLRFNERGPANLLALAWDKPRGTPDSGFLAIVQRFADQASLALAHSSAERLHARLEASLLPTAPVDHPRLDVVTRYRTGEQRLRLGGDFLGSVASENGVLSFVIGDVSGHGPDAAALGATLRSTWKALALAGQSLVKTTDIMTSLILGERNQPNAFATIVIGRIDPHKRVITWINAGHMPPLLITDKVVSLETPPTPPLGVGPAIERRPHHHRLPESWSLFCYTDGLVDTRLAPGSPKRYGEDGLRERLESWPDRFRDGDAVDTLLAEIEGGSGSSFADDVAVLLIATKDGVGNEPVA